MSSARAMNPHISDELPRLLSGEATHDTVLSAAGHLRACPDCYEELISAVVAHASLASAHRFAPEVLARDTVDLFGETDSADDAPERSNGQGAPVDVAANDSLPDLSVVFAQARAEAASPAARAKAKARSAAHSAGDSKRGRYLVAAAVAALLVGGGAASVALTDDGSGKSDTHQVALKAFGIGQSDATASVGGDGKLVVNASSLKHITGERYEVWLTDATRSSMQPVGWLDSKGTASLSVPTDLVGTYSYIEVSEQNVSAPSYVYSKRSVLRGKYAV